MDAEEPECQLLIDETTAMCAGGSKAQTPRLVRIAELWLYGGGGWTLRDGVQHDARRGHQDCKRRADSIRESMAAEQQAATGVKLNRQQRRMKAKKGKKKAAGGAAALARAVDVL